MPSCDLESSTGRGGFFFLGWSEASGQGLALWSVKRKMYRAHTYIHSTLACLGNVHTFSDPLLVGKVQLSARTIVNFPDTGAAVFDLAGRTFGVEWTGGLRRQK